MRSKYAKPQAVARGRADGVAGGLIGFLIVVGRRRADVGQAGFDRGFADRRQALASRAEGGNGGKALFDIVATLAQVPGDHGFDGKAVVDVGDRAFGQVLSQRPGLVAAPTPGTRRLVRLVDEPDLKRDQSKQQMAIGSGHEEAPRQGGVPRLLVTIRHRSLPAQDSSRRAHSRMDMRACIPAGPPSPARPASSPSSRRTAARRPPRRPRRPSVRKPAQAKSFQRVGFPPSSTWQQDVHQVPPFLGDALPASVLSPSARYGSSSP